MLLWSRFLLQVPEIAFRAPVFFSFAFWVFLYILRTALPLTLLRRKLL